jgi:hypothetical protein
MQQRERVVIGRMSRQELQAIVFEPAPNMKGYQLSETEAEEIKTLSRRATGQGSSDGRDGQRSPNGKWLARRTNDKYVLASTDGATERMLFEATGVLAAIRWSPNSEYFMWVEKSNRFDIDGHFWAVDDSCDVMIYRIQDGQRGRVYKVTEGYPYGQLEWLIVPPTVQF